MNLNIVKEYYYAKRKRSGPHGNGADDRSARGLLCGLFSAR
jgi:hypothetical protein